MRCCRRSCFRELADGARNHACGQWRGRTGRTSGRSCVVGSYRKSGQASVVGKLLDADFAWTDAEGKTQNKAKTLEDLSAFATDSQGEMDVKTLYYGRLEIVSGTRHDARFLRIWVKRPSGWRAFVDMDTPIPAQGRGAVGGIAGQGRGGDCVNPCKTAPYTPKTANEKRPWPNGRS